MKSIRYAINGIIIGFLVLIAVLVCIDTYSKNDTLTQTKITTDTIYVITQYSGGEIIYQCETTIKPTVSNEILIVTNEDGSEIYISGTYNVDSVVRKEE